MIRALASGGLVSKSIQLRRQRRHGQNHRQVTWKLHLSTSLGHSGAYTGIVNLLAACLHIDVCIQARAPHQLQILAGD